MPPYYDHAHYEAILKKHPAGEWFTPTNNEDESYTICWTLHEAGIIDRQRLPVWQDGWFRGYKTLFRYTD